MSQKRKRTLKDRLRYSERNVTRNITFEAKIYKENIDHLKTGPKSYQDRNYFTQRILPENKQMQMTRQTVREKANRTINNGKLFAEIQKQKSEAEKRKLTLILQREL